MVVVKGWNKREREGKSYIQTSDEVGGRGLLFLMERDSRGQKKEGE